MLEGIEKVYFLGLEGPGTSGLARILHERGLDVSGSASRENGITRALGAAGIDVFMESDEDLPAQTQLVVKTRCTGADHPLLVAARERGIPVVVREALLEETIKGYRTIGVAGTHGKGTVASMIAWVLEEAGWKPGFIIGGLVKNFEASARDGEGRWMVVELDDMQACTGVLKLDYVVCNFLEAEQGGSERDSGPGLDELIASMQGFLESNERLKEAFVNLDCTGNRRLVEDVALRPTGYGIEHLAEFRGEIAAGAGGVPCMNVHRREEVMGPVELSIPGDYQLLNALAAFAVTRRMGVDPDVIAHGLRRFKGVADRFDIVHGGGVSVIKDGAREPSKVRRVVESAKGLAKERLVAVLDFIPKSGVDVFRACTQVMTLGPLAASENEVFASQLEAMEGVEYLGALEALSVEKRLLQGLRPGDGVLFLGGEDAFALADRVGAELARQAGRAEPGPQQKRMDGPLTEG